MECPYCHSPKLDVVNSRKNAREQFVWRRRRCQECGLAFTTHERFFLDDLVIVRGTNKKTYPYHSSELLAKVSHACDHLHSVDKTVWLVRTIETSFMQHVTPLKDKLVINEGILHKSVLAVLSGYDKVSAIKYAAQENIPFEV